MAWGRLQDHPHPVLHLVEVSVDAGLALVPARSRAGARRVPGPQGVAKISIAYRVI